MTRSHVELRRALILQDYLPVALFASITYASILFYFLTCLVDPGYVKVAIPGILTSLLLCVSNPFLHQKQG